MPGGELQYWRAQHFQAKGFQADLLGFRIVGCLARLEGPGGPGDLAAICTGGEQEVISHHLAIAAFLRLAKGHDGEILGHAALAKAQGTGLSIELDFLSLEPLHAVEKPDLAIDAN